MLPLVGLALYEDRGCGTRASSDRGCPLRGARPRLLCRQEDEFLAHLDIWSQLDAKGDVQYPILLLSYHGDTERIILREDVERDDDWNMPDECVVSLQEIADVVGDCTGKVLHFTSCSTVDVGNDVVEGFLDKTRASAVSGYREEVDWGDSLAFDMLYLEKVQLASHIKLTPRRMKEVNDTLKDEPYSELREALGFSLRVPSNV